MNTRKHISLIISSVLAVLLCACTKSETAITDSVTSAPTTSISTEASVSVETKLDTSPISLSLFIDDAENNYSFDTHIAEKITERTGVTLEIIYPEDDITLDKMIESGNIPDLIYAGERTEEFISDGTLIPLDDYIENFGENFATLYGNNFDTLRHSDGKIYTFGTGGSSPAQFTATGTFQIQYAVLEELGYPEITTLEQLGECLSKYLEIHPECTGLLLCCAPHQQWLDTVSSRVNYVLGYPDDGEFLINNETGEAVYKWIDPRTKEFIKWLNQMYNNGILDDDSFSLKHEPYLNKISNGKVLAIADYYKDYASAEEKLAETGKYDKMYCPLPVAIDKDTKVPFLADYGFDAADGIGITSACTDPERAFRFLDWWCSDEAQYLMNFIGDDINGEFDSASENYAEDTNVGFYTEPFPIKGITEKIDGKYYSDAVSEYISSYSEPQSAAAEAYGISLFSELFPQSDELPVINRTLISEMEIPALSEEAIISEALETYIITEVQNAIKVPVDEFDTKWQEIVDWCSKNGAIRLSEIMTEYVRNDMRLNP